MGLTLKDVKHLGPEVQDSIRRQMAEQGIELPGGEPAVKSKGTRIGGYVMLPTEKAERARRLSAVLDIVILVREALQQEPDTKAVVATVTSVEQQLVDLLQQG